MEEAFRGKEDADGTVALEDITEVVEKALGAERAAAFAEGREAEARVSWGEVRGVLFDSNAD